MILKGTIQTKEKRSSGIYMSALIAGHVVRFDFTHIFRPAATHAPSERKRGSSSMACKLLDSVLLIL